MRGFATAVFTGHASALWYMKPLFHAPSFTPLMAVSWPTVVTIHRSAASEVSGPSIALDFYSLFPSGLDQDLQHCFAGLRVQPPPNCW